MVHEGFIDKSTPYQTTRGHLGTSLRSTARADTSAKKCKQKIVISDAGRKNELIYLNICTYPIGNILLNTTN